MGDGGEAENEGVKEGQRRGGCRRGRGERGEHRGYLRSQVASCKVGIEDPPCL